MKKTFVWNVIYLLKRKPSLCVDYCVARCFARVWGRDCNARRPHCGYVPWRRRAGGAADGAPGPGRLGKGDARSRPWERAWGAAALGLLAVVLLLGGCSGTGEPAGPAGPPGRLFGLAFGDAPGPGLARLAVPLPSALAESLAFYAAPGQGDAPFGAALTQATLAFWQGGLFSVEAALAAPADAPALTARLTRDLGPPHCREAASGRVCLWRNGDFEAVLEQSGDAARLMLRQAATAAAVAAALPQPPPLERAE
ncbi:hypothetical protein C3Y92_08285 [Solidesulfovibrio carbinolicus]|uniref:Uncharacterized protein n=1 Tax=Solidesulfovibrio carbinolicus TaxID=296842 RepID=A0A4P6I0I6_9BACT|nr:hypothetical protein C3Y92_08285 [Solidesulfovibrio carbinolicus]